MSFKLERPDGPTWHEHICEFMASKLPEDHHVKPGMMVVMASAGLMHIFVHRDDSHKGILGVSMYYTIPNPLRADKKLVLQLARIGVLPPSEKEYVSAVFDAFKEGWEWR